MKKKFIVLGRMEIERRPGQSEPVELVELVSLPNKHFLIRDGPNIIITFDFFHRLSLQSQGGKKERNAESGDNVQCESGSHLTACHIAGFRRWITY